MEEFTNSNAQDTTFSGAAPTKQKKGWKVALASVLSVVVVLGAASGIAYAASDTVKNFVKLNMGSDDNYYAWVLKNNAKDSGRKLSDAYQKNLNLSKSEPKSTISLDITLNDAAKDMLQEEWENLSSAKITCNGQMTEDLMGVDFELILNDTQIAEGNGIISEDTMYVQIPTISETYLSFPFSSLENNYLDQTGMGLSAAFMTPQKMEALLSPNDLNGLFETYGTLLSESEAEVVVTKDKVLSIGETSFSYTEVSATYHGENLQAVAEDLLNTLKDDATIQKFVTSSNMASEEDYKNLIQNALDEIVEDPATADDGVVLNLYVDATGTIRGCNLADIDDPNTCLLDCYVGKEDDQIGIYCNLADEINVQGILNETAKDTYSGDITATLDSADAQTIKINISDFKNVDEKHGYYTGAMTFSIPDVLDTFTLQFDSDGNSQSIQADIAVEGTNYATITCTIGTSTEEMTLELPADALAMQSETNMDIYMADANTDAVINNLETALGVSDLEEWINTIIFGNAEEDDFYNDKENEDPIPTDPTEETTEEIYEDDHAELSVDLSNITITCNGKPFAFFETNPDLIALLDPSQTNAVLEADDFNWYYNADSTFSLGIENQNAQAEPIANCGIFEIELYQGVPNVDLKVGNIGLGSSMADVFQQFGVALDSTLTTKEYYTAIFYDTRNASLAYSFYFQNGVITAMNISDYS